MSELVDNRIRELYKIHGRITPDIVIEDAKNPSSPLHSQFEWDVNAAALEAWRETARRLIRSVTVVVTTESKTFMAKGARVSEFVRDPSSDQRSQGYAHVYDIASDKNRARSALLYEIDRANAALARARALCFEFGLESEFAIATDAVKAMRKKATTAA